MIPTHERPGRFFNQPLSTSSEAKTRLVPSQNEEVKVVGKLLIKDRIVPVIGLRMNCHRKGASFDASQSVEQDKRYGADTEKWELTEICKQASQPNHYGNRGLTSHIPSVSFTKLVCSLVWRALLA
jgi:diaminopimelate decarboxylase